MNKKRLVVLISGSGSNLQAIIDAVNRQEIQAEIAAVISNRGGAFGLQRAQQANIATFVIEAQQEQTREEYDQKLAACIEPLQPDLIVLAGFMRILSTAFVARFADKMINIHPALLPAYKGLHTHQRALRDKAKWHGASVHLVTDELDGGPVIIQAKVPVLAQDTEQSLARRVLGQEHKIYPLVIKWFCNDRLVFVHNKIFFYDELLAEPIMIDWQGEEK